jgi:hypothetical protein
MAKSKAQTKKADAPKKRSALADVVVREYTIHMHKRVSLMKPLEWPA